MKKVIIGVIIAIACVAVGGGVAYATTVSSSASTGLSNPALTNQPTTAQQQFLTANPGSLTAGEVQTYSNQQEFSYNETTLYNDIQTTTDKLTTIGDFITCNLSQYFDYNGVRYYKVYDYLQSNTGQLADVNNNYSGLTGTFYLSTTGKMLKAIPAGVTLQVAKNQSSTQIQNQIEKNAAQYVIGNAPLEPNNAYVNFNINADLSQTKVVDGHTCYLVNITPKVAEQDGTVTGSTQNYNTTNIPKVPGTNNEQIYVSLDGYVYIPTHK